MAQIVASGLISLGALLVEVGAFVAVSYIRRDINKYCIPLHNIKEFCMQCCASFTSPHVVGQVSSLTHFIW